MNKHILPLLLGIAGTAGAIQAQADYVDIYEHFAFGGDTARIYVNDGIENLDYYAMDSWNSWNDTISSLHLSGSVSVRLYEHAFYTGDSVDITTSVADLRFLPEGNWNDRVSSIWVFEYPELGWYYDDTLRSSLYWEYDWFYHNSGLGWEWAGYYDRVEQAGWLYDLDLGYLYTDSSMYPWFWHESGYYYYYYEGSTNPRFFYSEGSWFASYGY